MNSSLDNFDFIYFRVQVRSDIEYLNPMVLPYTDLTILFSGEMTYFYNGEKITIYGGDSILFPPGTKRERLAEERLVYYVSFNVRLPQDFEYKLVGKLEKSVSDSTESILKLFENEAGYFDDYSNRRKTALFTYLYYQILSNVDENQNPYIKNVKNYIVHNISNPISVEYLAELVHLTPEYLVTIFKNKTGKTLCQYILDTKMNAAKQMIKMNIYSLNEIAMNIGYNNYSYFSRVFKKSTGLTPIQYKNDILK